MRSNTFASIYSANDINKIRMTGCRPAKALIEDILSREIPLKVLLRGLFKIGMKKCSFSILEKQTQTFNTWAINGKVLGTRQYSFYP